MNKLYTELRLFTLTFLFLLNIYNVFCIQLKLHLEKQVYQFPINHNLYIED